jgi:O-antigen/teichoic acid export membrane protein
LNLKSQSINGAIWTFVDMFVNKATYFIATIVLAGILGPKEFGLIGMIMLFVSIGNTLIDSGMSTSLLRSQVVSENEYATVFITNLFMSILVYIVFFFSAPLIATFYKQPILIDIIRLYCLGFIIMSLKSIHCVKLMREMRFKQLTMLNLPGVIVSVIVSIWMGKNGYGVWSLVALFLSNQLLSTIVFWVFMKWNPKFYFDVSNYKNHFNFGYKLLLSALLNTIFENIYNILIGKFYNVKTLGYYERAFTFNSYPVSILSGIVLKVTLPTLTSIKEDLPRMQKAYKEIMQMTFFITAYGLSFAALLSTQIVKLFLGNEWLPLVPLFQILSLSFVFYPIHSLNINILSVFGRSDLFLKLEVMKKIMIVLVVIVCFNFGILGLVWSSVFTSLLALLINTHYSGKFLNYATSRQLLDLLPTLLIVALTTFASYLFLFFVKELNMILQIFLSFLVGFFTLLLVSEKSKLAPYFLIKQLILKPKLQ